jgi:cytochrome c oxidase subunit II
MKRAVLGSLAASTAFAQQSALDAAGPNAYRIKLLGALFLVLLGLIFLIVIALALIPLARRHRGIEQEPLEQRHQPSQSTERKLAGRVGAATVITVLILFGLVIISVVAGKTVSGPSNRANALVIEITGNQWWWSVRYANDDASRIAVTANELHIPVGRPVMIRGTSNDVIHSFWVPSLQGKRDLIPSHVTTEWIQADRPGRFRGQCAEFCGLQHAHMALWVVAEPAEQFEAWLTHQLQPAIAPSEPVKQRGQQVFLNSGCVLCHAIQGTPAAGQVGPDLTHFASRLTIAAGTLSNNKGNLAGWIADPQNIKAGTHMATIPVKSEDVQPLLEYMESLQ